MKVEVQVTREPPEEYAPPAVAERNIKWPDKGCECACGAATGSGGGS
jgi:hypothetical protein